MTMTKRLFRWLAPSLLLLLALACTTQQPAAPFQPPEPTTAPNIAATVAARDRALPTGGPLPTAVPPEVIGAAKDFAVAYDALSEEWDLLNQDLAAWRLGFPSCDESSVPVALISLTGNFTDVSQAARDLSRHPAVRWMSDQLIDAAQTEESALRRLRDSWQTGQSGPTPKLIPQPESGVPLPGEGPPNDGPETGGAGQAGYEEVALARYESLIMRKKVADQLSDLTSRTSVESQRQVGTFQAAFDALSAQWDQFHEDYDSFRVTRPDLTSAETLDKLNALVEQHRQVVLTHRALPANPATQTVSDLVVAAIEKEDSALRRLRNSFQQLHNSDSDEASSSSQSSGGPVVDVGPLPAEGMEQANGEAGKDEVMAMEEATPLPPPTGFSAPASVGIGVDASGAFDALEEQIAQTSESRREARLVLDEAVRETSAANRAAVASFANDYDSLLDNWRSFHQEYDTWLATEGGCDRADVTAALGDFASRVGEIASSARQLPRATALRPLGELTVEAAEREEEALNDLRGNWRPFATSVYEDLDRELTASGKLRRQVDLGLQELLERYGIPAP